MCGFAGFTNLINDDGTVLEKMMNRIIHRGPDDSGKFVNDDIALGFRRLSIIDLSEGNQPMFNEDRSLVLVFNGEIYNYRELRAELMSDGHRFANNSDSEVLLHGYEQWGSELVLKLRGMFAFVIFDLNSKELFAARDMFGIKPLYYTFQKDSLLFASEIKAFQEHPCFRKEFNEEVLGHYLSFQYSPLTETFFKNVYKLPPAHYMIFKNNKLEVTRYWKPEFNELTGSLEHFADMTDKVIRESVSAHKIADVEVGAFLSGGIDSSYIAEAANASKTFTVGFESSDEKIYNEISYAKEFAEAIGAENIEKVITPEEYWNEFAKIQYHMDEPLADPSAIALYFVSKLARKHVKVVMSGEGADELFGGYRIYQEPLTLTPYDRLPMSIRRFISKLCENLPARRGINYLVRRGKTIEEYYIGNAKIFSYKERNKILKSESAKKAPEPSVLCAELYSDVKDKDAVTKMQYLDINMWMTGDILLKADKTSMANSLELRVPFLDKEVMKLASCIPAEYRADASTTKIALRKAAGKRLPKVTAERDKLGFPIPIRVWLREEKYYNIVKEAFTSDIGQKFFHTDIILALLDLHKSGKTDTSRKIWTIYTFIVWYKQFFDDKANIGSTSVNM
ncbi:MAG: asparagine synthase (glutamine-hydrolyzing) [Oscillospiraceae bacterium]|nr:asparagine synthase (glutamine-hydrolyzing) [Oscillospiraceae bacterium]